MLNSCYWFGWFVLTKSWQLQRVAAYEVNQNIFLVQGIMLEIPYFGTSFT